MDGTLLNGKKLIPKENIDVIYKLLDKGIHVMFSTGRTLESALSYGASIEIEPSIAGSNGAVVTYDNFLQCYHLDKNEIISYARKCQEMDMYYLITTEDTSYYYQSLSIFDEFYFDNSMVQNSYILEKELFNDIDEIVHRNDMNSIVKFDIFRKKRPIGVIKDFVNLDMFSVVNPDEHYMELTVKSASKGNAVMEVAQYYDIPMESVITIGDSENDLSMFQVAGLSIAMGNAQDNIKKSADMITDTNDRGGFAKAIKELGLV